MVRRWYLVRLMPKRTDSFKLPSAQRYATFLSETCGVLREQHRVGQAVVAARAGVDRSSIYRFEKEAHWPSDPDRLVAAYAEVIGVMDARELWEAALRRWRRGGSEPRLPSSEPVARAAKDLEQDVDAYLERRETASPEDEEESPEDPLRQVG